MSVYDDYEMTIGIECHVQLATKTKLFSRADNDARDKQPNTCVSIIDYGLPGMLPILNKQVLGCLSRASLSARENNLVFVANCTWHSMPIVIS
jgi:aspartyl-tRNA(Asn)/glutamyl-tRNA(Gln) amidotransferase subunit B